MIYYLDKIESLIVLTGVLGNGTKEYYVSYTTRFSMMRRWSWAYQNANLVHLALFKGQKRFWALFHWIQG